jgi:hypothetical protein
MILDAENRCANRVHSCRRVIGRWLRHGALWV